MGKTKINRVKLRQMLRDGKSQKAIARSMGVSEAAISKAKRELHINVVKNVALESAHSVLDESLDAISQLKKINDHANAIIDELSSSSERAYKRLILKACGEIKS